MSRNKIVAQSDEVLFKIVDLFFRQKMTVQQIARSVGLSRQAIYPLLAKARDRGFIALNPPVAQERANQIIRKFKCPAGSITVVNVSDQRMAEHVAAAAAARVLVLIKTLGESGLETVGLGLGPGRATLDFSRHLASLLPTHASLPKLKLFAISAGGPATTPEYASTSFFNLYPRDAISESVGFFAETLVPSSDLKNIRERPGVREAFEQKDEIGIVVTAMGDIEDEHDLLRVFLQKSRVDVLALQRSGWVGNVQYRPFTKAAPVLERDKELRAVTLFELDEFVQLAKTKNRHVVLIARQCASCGRNRAKAIHPLLRSPALKVWSEIVMDLSTANELLRLP